MNQETSQSYLDLSVLPELRTAVLSVDPIVVFTENLDAIVWSNATGAQLFGGTGVLDLLSVELPAENAVLRQLRYAVSQMDNGQRIVRGIRLSRTMRSQMLQFEIERISLLQSQPGYKVTQLVDEDHEEPSEHELAQLAVNSFAGFADAAAVVDDHGLPVSCSAEFGLLAPDDSTLAELIVELKDESDRLIKRPIEVEAGRIVAIGLARLTDNPGRSLIVIANVSDDPVEDSDEPVEQLPPTAIVLSDPTIPLDDVDNELESGLLSDQAQTDLEAEEFDETRDTSGVEELSESAETLETEETEEVTVLATDDIPQDDETVSSQFEEITEDEAAVTDTPGTDEIETESVIEETEDQTDNIPTKPAEPADESIRFAWAVDETGTFVSVSDELAEAVGRNPSNIIGRQWSDIAEVMGFDRNGEIAQLLSEKDTWSGKTVLWPIEGTKTVVPVDLAALPIYNTDREFEGFRGYGKIAISQIQEDPEALGLAFSEALGEDEPTVTVDFDDETDEPEIFIANHDLSYESSVPDAGQQTSNILPFSRVHENAPQPTLTEEEQQALEAVREHLQEHQSHAADIPGGMETSRQPVDTSLLEILPLAVLVYRNDETLFANQHLLEVSGYHSQEDLVAAGGVSALLATDEDVENKRNHYLLKKDGTRISVNAILHTVPWDGDKALLLSFTPPAETEPDVLEMTKVSEVQNILDTTTDGIILLDAEGKIISINAPAEALFGLDFEDALDQDLEFLFAEESRSTIRNYVDSVLTEGFESLINDGEEAIARESGGGMIPVFLTIAKMDQTEKICAVIRDITNWKKAEEELIQSKQHAEKANEQKSEFLAQVSHEIRTPLNAIIGFSDVMIEERFGPIENERYREYLRDIRRSGVHVLDIINELLDLSKVESGKLDLTFEAVSLNELVAETVALLQPQANSNRTIIRTSLSRSVPKVVADPRSIRQIILNLVSNAIKYSEANSQVIVSTVYETNGEVALRVRDTGKGMTPTEIEWAMKPFRQVHSVTENNPEGTGLGLPLTKALVEANRAYFELESNPGSGTIAHVQFPMQRVLAD